MNPSKDTIPTRSYSTAAAILVLAMLCMHVFFLWRVRDRIAKGDPDFTAFYAAGKILRDGRAAKMYDARTQWAVEEEFASDSDIRKGPLAFIHPPFEALIFVPFTYLSYPLAFVLWSALNVLLLGAAFWTLRPAIGIIAGMSSWKLVLVALAFFPVFANFHQGQSSILLLLVVSLSYRALHRNANLLAGCWIALGLFKYHFILPLFLVLAIWKGRKFVLGFAAVALVLGGVSLGIVGWQGALAYPGFVWNVVTHPELGGVPSRQLPNLMGLLTGWPGIDAGRWPMQAVAALFSGLLFLLVLLLYPFVSDRNRFELCFPCAVTVALLVGYNTNTYDIALLVLSLLLVADYSTHKLKENKPARMHLLLPIMPLLISPVWFFLWLKWERINLIAAFLLWWLLAIRYELIRTRVRQPELQTASGIT